MNHVTTCGSLNTFEFNYNKQVFCPILQLLTFIFPNLFFNAGKVFFIIDNQYYFPEKIRLWLPGYWGFHMNENNKMQIPAYDKTHAQDQPMGWRALLQVRLCDWFM